MSLQLSSLERELQQLQPLQSAHAALQRQYIELQELVRKATEQARSESSRLEAELRRVERCASGGSELRERARLAASAHARERKLATAELQHATTELQAANAEIARLRALVAELQLRNTSGTHTKVKEDPDSEVLAELRATLEAERAGSARLERALAAALADNAALAANLHAIDNVHSAITISQPIQDPAATNIGAIDSFLAE
ncbi:hypothetical protein evm_006709 [Chilo suppressalis]|nr:hypothetical protein evm_006709 [Chilo suppressalis]